MSLDLALQYLAWALYVAIFVLALARVLRTPTPAHWDIAAFFGTSAAVIVLSTVEGVLGGQAAAWLSDLTGALIMALPYLLLRLVATFTSVPRWLLPAAAAGLLLSTVALVLGPSDLPTPVVLLLVAYFVALTLFNTWAFAREAAHAAGVTQRRMQAVALGSGFLAGDILAAGLAAVFPASASAWLLLNGLCGLASGVAYYVGFTPPAWLRRSWQAPELHTFLARTARLPYLPDIRDVVAELKAHAAAAVGTPAAGLGLWLEDRGVLRFAPSTAEAHESLVRTLGSSPETKGVRFTMDVFDLEPGHMIAGRAFAEQRTLLSTDVFRDDPDYAAFYQALGVHAALATPITSGSRRLGVLVVYAPRAPLFAESDLQLVQVLADQAATVLESRRLLEEAAAAHARAETNRLKDEFLASISHDLRNPLAAVRGMAQVLQRHLERHGAVDAERLGTALVHIDSSTMQMMRLIDQLLDYARWQMDRPLELQPRAMDLVALTRRVVDAHAAASERHRVVLQTDEADVTGVWDEERIERVIQNLLRNALKYSPNGGDVLVRVGRKHDEGGDWAVLSVQDHGLGIPAADLPHVFERFHRAGNVAGRIAGTGIGLAAARQIVEQHGGTVAVESLEGNGSTFVVRLPLAPRQSPPSPDPGPGLVPGGEVRHAA